MPLPLLWPVHRIKAHALIVSCIHAGLANGSKDSDPPTVWVFDVDGTVNRGGLAYTGDAMLKQLWGNQTDV